MGSFGDEPLTILPMQILNITAYRFVALDDPGRWRGAIKSRCDALGLKGTILLAPEGINLFLAGAADAIASFLEWLGSDATFRAVDRSQPFADLRVKESYSETQPFRRMRVKQRREIVTMHRPTIRPCEGRAPAVSPETLSRWLSQGCDDARREVVLLDTRNAFEVALGSFDGARDLALARFADFPAALERVADDLRDKTVVAYCTGGIRCEKAALLMQESGIERVFQLEGGILDYFDKAGAAHWSGECFVFDERVALDAELRGAAEA